MNMLNEYAFARAVATECKIMGLPLPYQTISQPYINEDGKLVLTMCRIIHQNDKQRPGMYDWLMSQPDAEVSVSFISVRRSFDMGDYIVKREITTALESDDQDLLRALGKIVRQSGCSYEAVAC